MYKCPGCGAALRFDPASQTMLCDHCRTTLSPKSEELTHLNQSFGEQAIGNTALPGTFQSIVYTCPNCGGTIMSTDEAAVTFCNYCGSSVMLEGRLETEEAPDVIIPFRMSKDDCKETYRRRVKRALFAPNYMLRDTEIDKFRGIYMPYWIYAFYADGPTSGNGTTKHRSGDYIITDHYRVTRDIDTTYDGLSYDASADFSDVMSEAISPFKAVGAEPFIPSYMSGFYADVSDVEKEVYEDDAAQVALSYMASATVADPAYSTHGVSAGDVRGSIPLMSMKKRKGYFPVWFLANRIHEKNVVTYAVVNGESGKIAADLPVAFWKYILGALLLSVPVFFALNMLLTLTPKNALIGTIILSVVMLIALNWRINRTYNARNGIDKGVISKLAKEPAPPEEKGTETPESARKKGKKNAEESEKRNTGKGCLSVFLWILALGFAFAVYWVADSYGDGYGVFAVGAMVIVGLVVYGIVSSVKASKEKPLRGNLKAPFGEKMKYLIKPIIGLVAAVVVVLIDPVQDIWFYGAAILAEVLVIWCAFDAIALHNEGVFRPLPQFKKRGGTGNE